jgi:hypothetical protein
MTILHTGIDCNAFHVGPLYIKWENFRKLCKATKILYKESIKGICTYIWRFHENAQSCRHQILYFPRIMRTSGGTIVLWQKLHVPNKISKTYVSLLFHTARPNMRDGIAKRTAGVRRTYRDRGTSKYTLRQIASLCHDTTQPGWVISQLIGIGTL